MNSAKFTVTFQELNAGFKLDFGEIQPVSDGGYERGYEVGSTEGYAKGHEEGLEQGYADGYEVGFATSGDLAARTITGFEDNKLTYIGQYAFAYCTKLESVKCPAVTAIDNNAFNHCEGLLSADFPNVKTIGNYAFGYCYGLTDVLFPVAVSVVHNAFAYCSHIHTARLPVATSLGLYAFASCSRLTSLILESQTLCTLSGTNAFNGTPVANGTGYIYVPAVLVEQYKTAENWSTYAAQIRAIEDYPEITGGES